MKKGTLTKDHILTQGFAMASESGLDSLTIGALAKRCSLSKSGLFAHFQSKQNLQLAVLEFANQTFAERVISPARALGDDPIERKLRQLLALWLDWNYAFHGRCMFLDAWQDGQVGDDPLQQALHAAVHQWLDYLQIQIEKGQRNGEFCSQLNAKQATFELYGLYLAAHVFYSLENAKSSQAHFWQGVDGLLCRWRRRDYSLYPSDLKMLDSEPAHWAESKANNAAK
ncbi:TetR/AcrR family transcriptional regulator [Vibrio sp. SM6]|uniref:TetR/AcrR family transcriptional regulator n=1 Tax=Vibrio agarilyticus TaxID=2726741 RepID=A0A7X8TNP3_9VIBR|nr:TetR/AcrR family transcriptional regulator [Vibrio agarilyticus]